MTSCAVATTPGLVCRCDPRACASCHGQAPADEVFRKRNAWRMQKALRLAMKDTRQPSGPRASR